MPAESAYHTQHSAAHGNHLVAARALSPGTIVLREEAFAAVLYPDHYATHCHWSLRKADGLKRCGACKVARYASRAAQVKDFEEGGHRAECRALQALPPGRVVGPTLRLAAKVLWRRGREPEAYGPVEALEHHWEALSDERKVTFSQMATLTRSYMQGAGGALPLPEPREVALLLARFACNNHTLCDEELHPYGVGLFPRGALINHACRPNAVQTFRGRAITFRALQPIPAGAQVFISYSELVEPREQRRGHLLQHYHFDIDPPRASMRVHAPQAARARAALQPARTVQLSASQQEGKGDRLLVYGAEAPVSTDATDWPFHELCIGPLVEQPPGREGHGYYRARPWPQGLTYLVSGGASPQGGAFLGALWAEGATCAVVLGPPHPWWPVTAPQQLGDWGLQARRSSLASLPQSAPQAGPGAAVRVLELDLARGGEQRPLTALLLEAWPQDASSVTWATLAGLTRLLDAHGGTGPVAVHCDWGPHHSETLVGGSAVCRRLRVDQYSSIGAVAQATLRALQRAGGRPPGGPEPRLPEAHQAEPDERWCNAAPPSPQRLPEGGVFGAAEAAASTAGGAEEDWQHVADMGAPPKGSRASSQAGPGSGACTVRLWGAPVHPDAALDGARQLRAAVRAAHRASQLLGQGQLVARQQAVAATTYLEGALQELPLLGQHHWLRYRLLMALLDATSQSRELRTALAVRRQLRPILERCYPENFPLLHLGHLVLAQCEAASGSPKRARALVAQACRGLRISSPDADSLFTAAERTMWELRDAGSDEDE